jgi:tryptophan synthase alpha chain
LLSVISSSDHGLSSCWSQLRNAGRSALIPYLTAGFPDRETSIAALGMAKDYADIIEVGVPFSDPIADGPTIQASTFRALEQGMSLSGTLDLIDRAGIDKPIVLFSYLNPILQYGVERLIQDATDLGIGGILITDLPAGADPTVETPLLEGELDLIRLVAPTSNPARMSRTLLDAQGFVYLVARLGVTGASTELASGLGNSIAQLRTATELPIAVGFGISTALQASEVARVADGVVVGSALVDALGKDGIAGAETLLNDLRCGIDSA